MTSLRSGPFHSRRSILLLGLSLVAAACRPATPARTPAVVDDLGARVAVSATPHRIVSLAPSSTELLFALGFGDRVVGRTRWCDYPPAVAAVPSVGDGLNPNIEVVAARKPDLVVMYATAANRPAVEQLARLGIPAVNIKMDRLADVAHAARLLSALLGDSARVDSIARRFEGALDSLARVPHTARLRVAMIAWDNPPMVIGAGSFLTELIALAGGENVFADLPQPSPTVSIETIAGRNPDLLLLLASDSTGPALANRPEWRSVRAVREHRFVALNGTEFNRPSFRAVTATRKLQDALAFPSPMGEGNGVR
ncbi:MAG: ABC transporter substrate-binding protein [Gemmatimonadetes bacterium]|nr:ABC transporter substrate-binding protein [Gemmatimonadota bacterium]